MPAKPSLSRPRPPADTASRIEAVESESDLIARDDLALAAMHRRVAGQPARRAAQQDRGPAACKRAAAAAARRTRSARNTAERAGRPRASAPLSSVDQQRQAEHGAPGLPFGESLVGLGRDDKAATSSAGPCARARRRAPPAPRRCVSLSATPAKADTGMLSAMRMPASERRTTTRSRCSSTCRTRPSAAASLAAETQRQGERVEPQRAARPGGASAISHLTPQTLPRRAYAPGRWRIMAKRRRNALNVRG